MTQDNRGNLTAQDRIQQKLDLIERNPGSQVFVKNSKTGEELFKSLKIIDPADGIIREEWGFGVNDEQIKLWNDSVRELVAMAEKIRDLGIEIVASARAPRDIEVMVLKKEVGDFLDRKKTGRK